MGKLLPTVWGGVLPVVGSRSSVSVLGTASSSVGAWDTLVVAPAAIWCCCPAGACSALSSFPGSLAILTPSASSYSAPLALSASWSGTMALSAGSSGTINFLAVPKVYFLTTLACLGTTVSDSDKELNLPVEKLDSLAGALCPLLEELNSLGEALDSPCFFLAILGILSLSRPTGVRSPWRSRRAGLVPPQWHPAR